ncbi:MAG: hypothetical protein H0U52_07240 [Chloroflexi bacterium]|nr:hypothetical protein [Chloroflexota bacterium]
MPTRRTSPRRAATRPSVPDERTAALAFGQDDDASQPDRLAGAAPWLALLAIIIAAAALAFAFVSRGGGDLTACRSAAWAAVPNADKLPTGWQVGSTDLNANGLTVSLVGPAPADQTAQPPVVYASVTCYGDAAVSALDQNRVGAAAAGATITERTANGDAYDVDNPSTGSVTTLFRVGGLIGQIADAGSAAPADLAAITTAMATAMGDATAAGTGGAVPTDAATGSDGPAASDPLGSAEPDPSAFAPELEAVLPTDIGGSPLTIQSNSAAEIFGDDPTSRALAARIRAIGGTLEQLQVAQAYEDTALASIVAFRLPGADGAKLRAAVEEAWLSSGNEGVTTTTVTFGGKSLTKVDYGDDGSTQYVYGKDDYVVVIETSDTDVATEIASKLK